MLKKDYFDVKMVRKSEFEVIFEIAVEYQAEKVAEMAEKTTFLKNQAKFESFFEKKVSHVILREKIRGVSFLSFSKFWSRFLVISPTFSVSHSKNELK